MNEARTEERILFEQLSQQVAMDGKQLYAGCLLQYAARTFGDTIALIYENQTLSFVQLYHQACAITRVLKERGVKKGDRVLLCFENSPDFYTFYFGAWQAGAVVVPVNTFLKEHELKFIVDDAEPVIICTTQERKSLFEGARAGIVMPGDIEYHKTKGVCEIPELERDDVCALLYTSGTTGVPKGVMLSSRAIVTNVLQVATRLHRVIGVGERIFAALPLFHVFAQNTCVWAPMLMGCTVILVHKIDRRLILNALQHEPTFFLGVPALYGMLCMLKTAPLDSVKYFISGGDALPDKIRSMFALLYRRKIGNGYGLTETAPVVSVDLNAYTGPAGNVGRPLIDVTCEVRDEQGQALRQGGVGELWVSGPHIMNGYYHEPALTDQVLVNGFFRTGDLGYCDDRGTIVITGRVKDLIIHKGFNIYPQEIENILLTHANVIGVGVVGVIDEDGGEIPLAFVQLRVAQPSIEAELRLLCANRLAAYKIPRRFICSTDALPMTATGKVDKKALRAHFTTKQ